MGGTQTQTWASGVTWQAPGGPGASLSPGLPLPSPLPRVGWAGRRSGVLLRFQVFPALGQWGSLTNQLLQAHGVCGEGCGPRWPDQPQAVGVEAGRWVRCRPLWGSPPGSLASGCCSWWCWAGPSPASAWVSRGPGRGVPGQTLGAGAPAGVIRSWDPPAPHQPGEAAPGAVGPAPSRLSPRPQSSSPTRRG